MSEPSGTVFNIQKFSLHDGPGIRTTVFFKGCPLRCEWCANPESQRAAVQVFRDEDLCARCGICERSCPERAISFEDGRWKVEADKCSGCEACRRACPQDALSVEGKRMRVREALEVCLQDRDFYEESGGGVTLSGGEVLAQPEFAEALLRELKANGIHTALETAGLADPEVFARVASLADLLLFDVKHWSPEAHKRGAGATNERILANLGRAVREGWDALPRIPVIPGFNDACEDAERFAGLLRDLGLARAQLLPFHQFGESKYARLRIPYAYADVPPLHEEDLKEFRRAFIDAGVDAFF